MVAAFVGLPVWVPGRPQTSITAFFPEVDSYGRLTSNIRLALQAKGYVENGDFTRAELGPSVQFNLPSFEKLRNITVFDMDDMKPMPAVFSIGYRYLPPPHRSSRKSARTGSHASYSNAGAHAR